MPYINKESRDKLANWDERNAQTAGELNYLITSLCVEYSMNFGNSYKTINDIIGALECAKQEFYRRIASPYEDKKIIENGDVY